MDPSLLHDSAPDRYEPHAPAVPAGTSRTHAVWPWRGHGVHLEHVGAPDAPVRLLLIHGAGGNAAALWPYAAHLAALGAYVIVPDLPGYGLTRVPDRGAVRYGHWRQMLADLTAAENDDRPLVVVGASMGGMLAYETAALAPSAAAVAVTCLLDPRDPAVRSRLTWHPVLAKLAGPVLRILAGPAANLRVPIRWIADMRHIANDPALVSAVLADRIGGGGRVTLGWMRSFMESAPVVEPEAYPDIPVLMVHPGEDRWTPLEISRPFFDRIAGPKELVVLENCGHFPTEAPGFEQLLSAVGRLIANAAGTDTLIA